MFTISQHAGTGRIYPAGAGLAGASSPLKLHLEIVPRDSDGTRSFSLSPRRRCYDIARNDPTCLRNSGPHCSIHGKLYAMWSVILVNPRVSLLNTGMMVAGVRRWLMTFPIVQSFNIKGVAADPLEAFNIHFLTD